MTKVSLARRALWRALHPSMCARPPMVAAVITLAAQPSFAKPWLRGLYSMDK